MATSAAASSPKPRPKVAKNRSFRPWAMPRKGHCALGTPSKHREGQHQGLQRPRRQPPPVPFKITHPSGWGMKTGARSVINGWLAAMCDVPSGTPNAASDWQAEMRLAGGMGCPRCVKQDPVLEIGH